MRALFLLATGLGLASCYSVTETDGSRPWARAPGPAAVRLGPVDATLSSPSADPSAGILAYDRDLEACRTRASASLGSGAPLDDVAALKRALAEGPGRGAVSVTYRSDDLAVRRDRAVKTCLSKRGYVLKD